MVSDDPCSRGRPPDEAVPVLGVRRRVRASTESGGRQGWQAPRTPTGAAPCSVPPPCELPCFSPCPSRPVIVQPIPEDAQPTSMDTQPILEYTEPILDPDFTLGTENARNRWSATIPPVLTVPSGAVVELRAKEASDGARPTSTPRRGRFTARPAVRQRLKCRSRKTRFRSPGQQDRERAWN